MMLITGRVKDYEHCTITMGLEDNGGKIMLERCNVLYAVDTRNVKSAPIVDNVGFYVCNEACSFPLRLKTIKQCTRSSPGNKT